MKSLVLFLVGPTASGKSALAVALAKKLGGPNADQSKRSGDWGRPAPTLRSGQGPVGAVLASSSKNAWKARADYRFGKERKSLGGEILSADSMLVYKGMDVGTAKPTKKERGGIPHHGLDLIPPTKSFSVFAYRQFALKAIRDISKRGKVPIVAGGTGFYVRALLEGLSPLPGANARMRRELEREALEKGLPALYKRLLKLDPLRAKAIGPHNQRRLIRALEIYLISGKKPSASVRKTKGLKELGFEPVVIGIHRDRDALYQKINRRVDAMFAKGLVREVKRLARKKLSATALQGVGYKETLEWISPSPFSSPPRGGRGLGEGAMTKERLSQIKEKIKQTTRHFAKRQWTWFKRERGIRWVWWPETAALADVSNFIMERFFPRDTQGAKSKK